MPDQDNNQAPHRVRIEKWVYGGSGLARGEGRVTLVPYVMPGEEVEIEPLKQRTGLVEGRLANVLEASAERSDPGCPYFGDCGGCHYRMAPYEFELARKREILREVFVRVGKMHAPDEIETLSAEPTHYRNRSQFHVAGHTFGMKAAGSNRVVDVRECPISAPLINETLKKLRALRRQPSFPRFLKEIELFTNGEQTMVNVLETEQGRGVAKGFFEWLGREIAGAAEGSLEYQTEGALFRVSHQSFFQVNRFLIDALVGRALDGAAGESALDLYAGVGLFSIALARRFTEVVAVESDSSAVRDLEFNATRAGVNVRAHRLQSEQYLEGLTRTPDFVLADPPRSGLGKLVVSHLIRLRPPRLTVVSCDPATLARDMAALVGAGYRFTRLTMVDLFPRTYHIESIACLEL